MGNNFWKNALIATLLIASGFWCFTAVGLFRNLDWNIKQGVHFISSKEVTTSEVDHIQFNTMTLLADLDNNPANIPARMALSDGVVSQREYDQVIKIFDANKDIEYQQAKTEAIAKWKDYK